MLSFQRYKELEIISSVPTTRTEKDGQNENQTLPWTYQKIDHPEQPSRCKLMKDWWIQRDKVSEGKLNEMVKLTNLCRLNVNEA